MIDGWSPSLVGPTLFGWVMVLLYFSVAALCWRNSRLATAVTQLGPNAFLRARIQRRIWLGLAASLLLLGINKEVDLQTLATVLGRHAAQQGGWYGSRRSFQRELIALLLLVVTAGGSILVFLARRAGGWAMTAVIDTVALIGFVAVRATSLHGVDLLLSRGWGPMTINRCLETGLIAFDAIAARAAWHQLRSVRADSRHPNERRSHISA